MKNFKFKERIAGFLTIFFFFLLMLLFKIKVSAWKRVREKGKPCCKKNRNSIKFSIENGSNNDI